MIPKNPIAIVAPYPGHDRYLDGWMSRIKTVDTLLSKYPRIYIDFQEWFPPDAEPETVHADDRVKAYRVNPASARQAEFVARVFDTSPFVYIHTLHQCEYMLEYYDPDRMLVDIHGVVPEEELMMGSPERSRHFAEVERQIFERARYLAVVTRAMRDHYRGKYPASIGIDFIHLPVYDFSVFNRSRAGLPEMLARRRRVAKDRAIYAGGAQIWQCVDLMFDCMVRGSAMHDYEIYSHDVAEFTERLKRQSLPESIFKGYVDKKQLALIYQDSAFGFVLREECVVNRVASPTKICDYCSSGVIPIVKFAEIGDFKDLGYVYVDYQDYLDGFVPDADSQAWMIARNLECMEAMHGEFRQGASRVLGLVGLKS